MAMQQNQAVFKLMGTDQRTLVSQTLIVSVLVIIDSGQLSPSSITVPLALHSDSVRIGEGTPDRPLLKRPRK